MKNKILIIAVIVLAAALIFENAYLLGLRRRMHRAMPMSAPVRVEHIRQVSPMPSVREIRSWDPLEEMRQMQEIMNRLFAGQRQAVGLESSVSFNDTGAAYVVRVSLQGIRKEDIDIQVKDRRLVISARAQEDSSKKGKDFISQQAGYRDFLSSFILPEDAKADKISSDYKNGILTITIPRQGIEAPAAIKVPVK